MRIRAARRLQIGMTTHQREHQGSLVSDAMYFVLSEIISFGPVEVDAKRAAVSGVRQANAIVQSHCGVAVMTVFRVDDLGRARFQDPASLISRLAQLAVSEVVLVVFTAVPHGDVLRHLCGSRVFGKNCPRLHVCIKDEGRHVLRHHPSGGCSEERSWKSWRAEFLDEARHGRNVTDAGRRSDEAMGSHTSSLFSSTLRCCLQGCRRSSRCCLTENPSSYRGGSVHLKGGSCTPHSSPPRGRSEPANECIVDGRSQAGSSSASTAL